MTPREKLIEAIELWKLRKTNEIGDNLCEAADQFLDEIDTINKEKNQ